MIASGKQNYLKMANCLPIEGGMPLFYKSELIGSIGISGVTSAQDGQVAAAGVAKLAALESSN
jgi:glc operon protein GlcG